MSEPNFFQKAGNFAVDAEADTVADNLINEGIEMVGSRIPGEQMIDAQLRTEIDQVANNALNSEISNLEGRFGGGWQQSDENAG